VREGIQKANKRRDLSSREVIKGKSASDLRTGAGVEAGRAKPAGVSVCVPNRLWGYPDAGVQSGDRQQ